MNEYINTSCNSSVAPSCVESAMDSFCDEGKVATPFTEGVSSSAEVEMAIDGNASAVSLAQNLCVELDLSVAVQ